MSPSFGQLLANGRRGEANATWWILIALWSNLDCFHVCRGQ